MQRYHKQYQEVQVVQSHMRVSMERGNNDVTLGRIQFFQQRNYGKRAVSTMCLPESQGGSTASLDSPLCEECLGKMPFSLSMSSWQTHPGHQAPDASPTGLACPQITSLSTIKKSSRSQFTLGQLHFASKTDLLVLGPCPYTRARERPYTCAYTRVRMNHLSQIELEDSLRFSAQIGFKSDPLLGSPYRGLSLCTYMQLR